MRQTLLMLAVLVAAADRPGAQSTIVPRTSTVALTHVRLIDGTGDRVKDDQTVVVEAGRIRSVGASSSAVTPQAAEVLDLRGRTVIPGLVGMHEHLFYQLQPPGSQEQVVLAQGAFARLYLAAGVTTIRTAGTVEFNADKRIKQWIDTGKAPGPKIHLTSPYLGALTPQPDPDGIAKVVEGYAAAGATSFKAYTTLRASELKAAIKVAHDRGLRVTGHLCAVGFHEAAELGIDNIEHGLPFDTELYGDKRHDECPNQSAVFAEIGRMHVGDAEVRNVIRDLVWHGVAVTSTLAVLESYTGDTTAFDPRVKLTLAPSLRSTYARAADGWSAESASTHLFAGALHIEMAFERAFVAAGGRLLAGVDPTGWGGVIAGFGDQRELELLVQAGFPAEKAIQIATSNGAKLLDEPHIGTVAPGEQADLVVVRGDLVSHMSDIRNVELVFKDGVAYDPALLLSGAEGSVGSFDMTQLFAWRSLSIMGVVSALVINRVWRSRRKTI
jgi:imidazolonepropionase-like amidohydrolase